MVLNDIRSFVQDTVFARPVAPGRCRSWASPHVAAIRAESLGPWLYRALRNAPQADLPRQILADLHHDYMLSALATVAREQPLARLLSAFEADGLPAILLKGLYLSHCVYDDPALRPMGDADLMVPEDRFEDAGRILASLGGVLAVEDTDIHHEILNRARVYSMPDAHSLEVDLHRAIWAMDYYRIPSSVIRTDAKKSSLYGQRVYFLSSELNFLHLGVHNLNHVGGIRDWLDLILMLCRGMLDWDRLLAMADQTGLTRPMHHLFNELATNWGYAPPPQVRHALAEYKPHWLEDRVIKARFRYPWRLFSRLRLIPQWRVRLDYLRDKAFSTRPNSGTSSKILERLGYLGAKWNLFAHFWRRGR